jgi:tetratricopeptide (TPR) repeat protein
VSQPLGRLATTLARYDDAEHHFEHALTIHTQIKAPVLTAFTQHAYAQMLLLRNHAGDSAKALRLLTQALAAAEQLGLKALADTTRPLKLKAEAGESSLASHVSSSGKARRTD